jgi:hypothetical protein
MSYFAAPLPPLPDGPVTSDTPVRLAKSSRGARSDMGLQLVVIGTEPATDGTGIPRVAGCFSQGSIVVFNGQTGERLEELKSASGGFPYSLTVYRTMGGEERIACGMRGGDVEIYEAVAYQRLRSLEAFGNGAWVNRITTIKVRPHPCDPNLMGVQSRTELPSDVRCVQTLRIPNQGLDGRPLVVAAGPSVVVFDPETATKVIEHTHHSDGGVYRLFGYLSEEGRPVVVSGEINQELHAFDAETDAMIFEERWPEGRGVWSLLAFDDAATGAPRVAVGYENGSIRIRWVARRGDDHGPLGVT